jgi:hypothetical protein
MRAECEADIISTSTQALQLRDVGMALIGELQNLACTQDLHKADFIG